MGFAQKGAEFGRKLAEPHQNKPGFVLVVALIVLGLGIWIGRLYKSGPDEPEFCYWLGIILKGAAGIGLLRFTLLLCGLDFPGNESKR